MVPKKSNKKVREGERGGTGSRRSRKATTSTKGKSFRWEEGNFNLDKGGEGGGGKKASMRLCLRKRRSIGSRWGNTFIRRV